MDCTYFFPKIVSLCDTSNIHMQISVQNVFVSIKKITVFSEKKTQGRRATQQRLAVSLVCFAWLSSCLTPGEVFHRVSMTLFWTNFELRICFSFSPPSNPDRCVALRLCEVNMLTWRKRGEGLVLLLRFLPLRTEDLSTWLPICHLTCSPHPGPETLGFRVQSSTRRLPLH